MMIPTDRPVTPRDLVNLRKKLGLRTTDFLYLLNISMLKWCNINRDLDRPVKDPAIAILARILDADPNASIIPKAPSPKDVLDQIRSFTPYATMPYRSFGIYFGRDSSASYRWLNQKTPAGPTAERLLLMMEKSIEKQGLQGIDWWKDIVNIESKARGIENVWLEGMWASVPIEEDADEDEKPEAVDIAAVAAGDSSPSDEKKKKPRKTS